MNNNSNFQKGLSYIFVSFNNLYDLKKNNINKIQKKIHNNKINKNHIKFLH